MDKYISKVVGVTFENRQETLRKLREENVWRDLTLIHTTFHNEKAGIDEPAIKVVDYKTKKEIGWIARTDLETYKNIYQMTGFFGIFNDTEYVELYTPKQPSQKQHWAVRKICERRGVNMPMYDVRAYESIFKYERLENQNA